MRHRTNTPPRELEMLSNSGISNVDYQIIAKYHQLLLNKQKSGIIVISLLLFNIFLLLIHYIIFKLWYDITDYVYYIYIISSLIIFYQVIVSFKIENNLNMIDKNYNLKAVISHNLQLVMDDKIHIDCCAICLDNLRSPYNLKTVFQLKCYHQFHLSCIIEWLKNNIVCPICKLELKKQLCL